MPKFKHRTTIYVRETDSKKRRQELQSIVDFLISKGERVANHLEGGYNTIIYISHKNEWSIHYDDEFKEVKSEITFEQLKEMFEEPFDPSKPFEVSDDAMNWCKGFDYYVGCEKRLKCCHVVSDGWDLAQFKYIRNIQTQKIKRSEIISVTTSQGTFTNFVIEE